MEKPEIIELEIKEEIQKIKTKTIEITQGSDDMYKNLLQVANQFARMKRLKVTYEVNIQNRIKEAMILD